jgi:hypothetical protein
MSDVVGQSYLRIGDVQNRKTGHSAPFFCHHLSFFSTYASHSCCVCLPIID